MLRALSIRDYVIVERLDLELASGFTALTGETGAGKSILIDALMLALGDRADPGETHLSQAADRAGRQLSKPEGADRRVGVMEFCSGARESAG